MTRPPTKAIPETVRELEGGVGSLAAIALEIKDRLPADAEIDETVRFLSIRRTRRLDVVARHRRWQRTVDPDAFLTELFGAPR